MPRPWPLLRWPGAAVAGLLVALAFQPYGLWPLAFVGVAGLTLAVRGTRPRTAAGLGYVFGFVLLAVSVGWVHVISPFVALALWLVEAVFFALLGLALRLLVRLPGWPVSTALAWSLVEFSYSRVPFGGFGWIRMGYSQVDSPLAGLFPVVGVVGVSLATVGVGQLLAWLVLRVRRALAGPDRPLRMALAPVLASVLALAVLAAGGQWLRGWDADSTNQTDPTNPTHPTNTDSSGGVVQVGIVQGNVPGRGIEALGRARTVTMNHLNETIALLNRARTGQVASPDFLLWPENSTDIDPTRDVITRQVVQQAVQLAGVPILVGAVMEGPGPDERQTSALWWDPDRGILARYDKRNLVPFGEWIPFRSQLLPLVPMLKEVGPQSVPGTTPGVLRVPLQVDGTPREIAVGDVICFELAYDRTFYDTLTSGAQVLTVQSNNATYGGTGQIEQQFAITRARAMEARREIAVATTDSVSGLIDRTGNVSFRTQQFTAASTVVPMPLRSGLTPAILIAPWLDRGLALAAGCWLLAAVAVGAVTRRSGPRPGVVPVGQDGTAVEPPKVSSIPCEKAAQL